MNQMLLGLGLLAALCSCASSPPADQSFNARTARSLKTMDLGNFSVSLTVKDLGASREFYRKLGFEEYGGDPAQNWIILRNGGATIGLFQGMFEQNILTFNPGWTRDATNADEYTDIRELQKQFKASGLTLISEADESTTGPASLMMADPDGNMILVDQHR